MISFSTSEFCKQYIPSYFSDCFQVMSKQNNGGFVDDIDANWNIFIMVDNFNTFMNSLRLDALIIKQIIKDNFIIPIQSMVPDKISNYLKDEAISTIIVEALNPSSVSIVQLMFRLFLTHACGHNQVSYDDFIRIISDARIKAGNLEPQYQKRLFQYVFKICLKSCNTKGLMKMYKGILQKSDLFDQNYDKLLTEVYNRINESKNRSGKKQQTEQKMQIEDNGLQNIKTPTKRKNQKQPKLLKALQFNPKNFILENKAAQSAQKPISIKSTKPTSVPRTIFAITNKKFIPKKNFDIMIDSTKPSPSSRKYAVLDGPTKRSHSSIYYAKDFGQLNCSVDVNCLADQTPVIKTKFSEIVNTSKKTSSSMTLNFDTSSKKNYKRN